MLVFAIKGPLLHHTCHSKTYFSSLANSVSSSSFDFVCKPKISAIICKSHDIPRRIKTRKSLKNGRAPNKNNEPKIIPANTPKIMNSNRGKNTNHISFSELLELRSMRSVQTALMPNRKPTTPHTAMITMKAVPLFTDSPRGTSY